MDCALFYKNGFFYKIPIDICAHMCYNFRIHKHLFFFPGLYYKGEILYEQFKTCGFAVL